MKDAKDMLMNKKTGGAGIAQGAMKGGGISGDNYKGKNSGKSCPATAGFKKAFGK